MIYRHRHGFKSHRHRHVEAPRTLGTTGIVEVGARVELGSVLCIVEVMKLMNNVEAPAAGVVTSILAVNNETVEYGQPLIVIRADG
ncbi:acetyl-CoA carboxylase biotin carboxyl carrier protein [Microbacterium sp. HJ5]